MTPDTPEAIAPRGVIVRSLDLIERVGNRLPDPAVLFLLLMLLVWAVSWALSGVSFEAIDPRSGSPIVVNNLLSGASFTAFMSQMVPTFVSFPPLGGIRWPASRRRSPACRVGFPPRCCPRASTRCCRA